MLVLLILMGSLVADDWQHMILNKIKIQSLIMLNWEHFHGWSSPLEACLVDEHFQGD